jgi:hypothetical protein
MAIEGTDGRTLKPGFGRRTTAPRTWTGVAPDAKVAKRSRAVALGAASGIGLVGLYGLLAQPSCDRPVNVAKAEAERGRILSEVERAALADEARRQEESCRRRRTGWWNTGRAFSSGAGRGWFSSAPRTSGAGMPLYGSRPAATTTVSRGGFGRSGFSFGG